MDWRSVSPEIFLTAAALLLFVGDAFRPGQRRLWLAVAGLSVVGAIGLLLGLPANTPGPMVVSDGLSLFFKLAILGSALCVLCMSADFWEFGAVSSWGTYAGLLLIAAVGAMLLASAVDFLMMLIAVEILGISSFILTGYLKEKRGPAEAAIKFFLIGAFSSGMMIYGISIFYGLTGTTGLNAVRVLAGQVFLSSAPAGGIAGLPLAPTFVGAAVLVLAALCFKLALAPFHVWAPDVYEGAPTPVTAFLSTVPKAAGLAALIRVFEGHTLWGLSPLLAWLAVASMTLGNLAALPQTNVKRLLAYSSIAQMGYVMAGFVAAGPLGTPSVLVYTAVYVFMNLGAFACVLAVTNDARTEELDAFSGLAQRNLPLALACAAFFFSLTGLPPLAGFIGKFSIVAAAMEGRWVWLAAVVVANSVVSLYYYFGVVRRMFFSEPVASHKLSLSPALTGCVGAALLLTLAAGVFPHTLLAWARAVAP